MANQEKLLIIVESPSKTKTISKYIDHAKVIASIGHFKDLPKKELGIDIEKDFEMNVQTLSDRKKFITELKNETKSADRILIATDPDREGEAIAAHIAEEIDKETILHALVHEGLLHGMNLWHPSSHFVSGSSRKNYMEATDNIINYLSNEDKELIMELMIPEGRDKPAELYYP